MAGYSKFKFLRRVLLLGFLCLALAAPKEAFAQMSEETQIATRNLFVAIDQNDFDAVQASIAAGADLDAVNQWRMTAADYAVEKGYFDIAHFLLSAKKQKQAAEKALQGDNDNTIPQATAKRPPPPKTKLPPRPSQKAKVESQPLTAAPAPKPAKPAWPSNKPNPFDPNYVASGSMLKATGPVRSAAELEAEERRKQDEARRQAEAEKAEKLREIRDAEQKRQEELQKQLEKEKEKAAREKASRETQEKQETAERVKKLLEADREAERQKAAEVAKATQQQVDIQKTKTMTEPSVVRMAAPAEPVAITPKKKDHRLTPEAVQPLTSRPSPTTSVSTPSPAASASLAPAAPNGNVNQLYQDAEARRQMARTEEAYRRAARMEAEKKETLASLKQSQQQQKAALQQVDQAKQEVDQARQDLALQVKKFEQTQQVQRQQLADAKARTAEALKEREAALSARREEEARRLAAIKEVEAERKKAERLAFEKARLEEEAKKQALAEAKQRAELETKRLAEQAERHKLERLRLEAEAKARRLAEAEAKRKAAQAKLEMAKRAVEGKPKVHPDQVLKLAEQEKKQQALEKAKAAERARLREIEKAEAEAHHKKEMAALRARQEKEKADLLAKLEREAREEKAKRKAQIEEARYTNELGQKMALPKSDPAMEKATIPTTETYVAEARSAPPPTPRKPEITHEEKGFFDQLAEMIGLESDKPANSEQPPLYAEPVQAPQPASAPKDAMDKQMAAITAKMPYKPRAEFKSATYLPDVQFRLAENLTLHKAMPPDSKPDSKSKNCVWKKHDTVAFCLEQAKWPLPMKPHVSTSSVLYKGNKAIVRYDGERASRYHSLFPAESFEAVANYFGQKYGLPTEQWKRSIIRLAKPKLPNPTFIWRSIDTRTKLVTTLEIRKYDDTRGGFPDTKRGAILLYNAASEPIFPALSALELMSLKP